MTLADRLKLVRGATSQKAFAGEIGVHENTVSNAERRGSASHDYLRKLAAARQGNLHWLSHHATTRGAGASGQAHARCDAPRRVSSGPKHA